MDGLAAFLVGIAVSFLVLPYDQGGCPSASDCGAVGYGLRMLGVLVTFLTTFVLLSVGAIDRD